VAAAKILAVKAGTFYDRPAWQSTLAYLFWLCGLCIVIEGQK